MNTDLFEKLVYWVRPCYFGKYRGTVIDNADPAGRARLKVRVPSVLGGAEVWAVPRAPYASGKVGVHFLPELDTSVWVEFESGDPARPLWSGMSCADDELSGGASDMVGELFHSAAVTMVLDGTFASDVFIDDATDIVAGDDM